MAHLATNPLFQPWAPKDLGIWSPFPLKSCWNTGLYHRKHPNTATSDLRSFEAVHRWGGRPKMKALPLETKPWKWMMTGGTPYFRKPAFQKEQQLWVAKELCRETMPSPPTWWPAELPKKDGDVGGAQGRKPKRKMENPHSYNHDIS